MAHVTVNGKQYQVDPTAEESLMEQLKAQGVEIVAACNGAGICQTCAVIVHEGEEGLTDPSETEEMMGMPENQRMSCQCKIKCGDNGEPVADNIDIELVY